MPRFSIIVPSHNVEPYIAECLDSLVGQTFSDIEIICVNDVSTDGTEEVIRGYAERDARVKLISNEVNMQLFATRHVGVAASSGDYVMFVDGDDVLDVRTCEYIDEFLKERPVDILQFGVELIAEDWVPDDVRRGYSEPLDNEYFLLEGDDVLEVLCKEKPYDFYAHHKVFEGDLARRVLGALGLERGLHVAEDITELIALLIEARSYLSVPHTPFYLYHFGRGQTKGGALTAEQFNKHAATKRLCYDNLMAYLDREGLHNPHIDSCAEARWRYAAYQNMNTWQDLVALEDREETLRAFAELWDALWVVPNVYRFLRDDAYALFVADDPLSEECAPTWARYEANKRAFEAVYPDFDASAYDDEELAEMKRMADTHARDLERRLHPDQAEAEASPEPARGLLSRVLSRVMGR